MIRKIHKTIWVSERSGLALLEYDHDADRATILIDGSCLAAELMDLADAIIDLPLTFIANGVIDDVEAEQDADTADYIVAEDLSL